MFPNGRGGLSLNLTLEITEIPEGMEVGKIGNRAGRRTSEMLEQAERLCAALAQVSKRATEGHSLQR